MNQNPRALILPNKMPIRCSLDEIPIPRIGIVLGFTMIGSPGISRELAPRYSDDEGLCFIPSGELEAELESAFALPWTELTFLLSDKVKVRPEITPESAQFRITRRSVYPDSTRNFRERIRNLECGADHDFAEFRYIDWLWWPDGSIYRFRGGTVVGTIDWEGIVFEIRDAT